MNAMTLPSARFLPALAFPLLISMAFVAVPSRAHEGTDHQHHQASAAEPLKRSQARYEVPDVVLTDAGGNKRSLRTVLADKTPLMLNFIFTTCTSVCPVMSGVFTQVQSRFNKQGQRVRMVSISIDPEYDTPARLKDYAKNFSAGPDWLMLTGRVQDSVAVQRAFDAYRGDKMSHEAITYLRGSSDQTWLRLDGLASADELVTEYRRLTDH